MSWKGEKSRERRQFTTTIRDDGRTTAISPVNIPLIGSDVFGNEPKRVAELAQRTLEIRSGMLETATARLKGERPHTQIFPRVSQIDAKQLRRASRMGAERRLASLRLYGGGTRQSITRHADHLKTTIRRKKEQSKQQNEAYSTSRVIDTQKMVRRFTKPNGDACCIVPISTETPVSLLMREAMNDEQYLYVVSNGKVTARLFDRYSRLFAGEENLKGDSFEDNSGNSIGKARRQIERLPKVNDTLGASLRNRLFDENSYMNGFQFDHSSWPDTVLSQWNIYPISDTPTQALAKLKYWSLASVFVSERFGRMDEERKVSFLQRVDTAIRYKGFFVVEDNPESLAALEYYAHELWGNTYQQIQPERIIHPANWMVFQKRHPSEIPKK